MKIEEIKYQLIQLGLTDYESKGYLSMLSKQTFTASELSKISGIPRTRAYEVLQRLVQKGICVEILGKIKKYTAVPPEIAISRLLEYQKAEFTIKENLAKSVFPILKKQYTENITNQDPLDYIKLYREPNQVSQQYINLIADSQREILVFTKPPFSKSADRLKQQNTEEIKAIKRNVTYKALYEIDINDKNTVWKFKQINSVAKAGGESRIIEELPLKMAIFDERKVIFAMEDYHPTKNLYTSLVIEHRALAKSLKIIFNTLWHKSQDYHDFLEIK